MVLFMKPRPQEQIFYDKFSMTNDFNMYVGEQIFFVSLSSNGL